MGSFFSFEGFLSTPVHSVMKGILLVRTLIILYVLSIHMEVLFRAACPSLVDAGRKRQGLIDVILEKHAHSLGTKKRINLWRM